MKNQHLATLDKEKKTMLSSISKIKENIRYITEMFNTTEVLKVSAYKSKDDADGYLEKKKVRHSFSFPEIESQEIISKTFCKILSRVLPLFYGTEREYERFADYR